VNGCVDYIKSCGFWTGVPATARLIGRRLVLEVPNTFLDTAVFPRFQWYVGTDAQINAAQGIDAEDFAPDQVAGLTEASYP
jgi:hypothetical protein